MDFRQVTNLFADPDFDGEPVQSAEFKGTEIIIIDDPYPMTPGKSAPEQIPIPSGPLNKPRKYYVNGVEVKVLNERVQMFDKDGKLITQSLRDYTKQQANAQFKSLDGFLQKWKKADQKAAILKELSEQGIFLNELREEVGKDFDDFDLICHVAFDQKLVTRKERANSVKKGNYFVKYGQKARAVVDALLDKYSDEGIENMESLTILKVNPFPQFGTPLEIVGFFGGKEEYLDALHEIENQLYR